MKKFVVAALMITAFNAGAAINPMDQAPTLVLASCPVGMEWAIEPGGVGFCRIPIIVTAPEVVAVPGPAEMVPEAPISTPTTTAPEVVAVTETTTTPVAPIPLDPVASTGDTSGSTGGTTAPQSEPVATALPAPSTSNSSGSSGSTTDTTVTSGGGGISIGSECNGRDWMTQRIWSDGHVDWRFTPGWMNHDSSTPFIDPDGVQHYDIVNNCG